MALSPDEVIITETPREGWSVASDAGATVALDLEITPELRRAGLARDAIRLIQEARKNSGLDVADRIAVRWHAVRNGRGAHRARAPWSPTRCWPPTSPRARPTTGYGAPFTTRRWG